MFQIGCLFSAGFLISNTVFALVWVLLCLWLLDLLVFPLIKGKNREEIRIRITV